MLSRNNKQEQFRKQEQKKQRYTIKKLTVGVASVLIGFTFMGMNASADTDTTSANNTQPANEPSATNSENTNAVSLKSSAATTQTSDTAALTTPVSNQKSAQGKQNLDVASTAKDNNSTTPVESTSKRDSVADEYTNKVAQNYSQALAAIPAEQNTENLRGTQMQEVSDWQGFVNALNDSSVGTINIIGDINVANKGTNINGISRPNPVVNGGKMELTGSNISGGLIIDGQGHAINFGANYLSFDTNNQKNSNPWDIHFKNLTINADGYDNSWSTYGGAFSPFYMGGDSINTDLLAKNKVTFENVNADIKNGAFFTTTMATQAGDSPYATVTFKGDNNITCEKVNVAGNQLYNYSSAVSAAHIIFAEGTNTTFNVSAANEEDNGNQNAGGNILRAKAADDQNEIVVEKGATLNLNGKSADIRGMLVNNAITGTVQVDGNVNANMGTGHSVVVWAGNLNIGKDGAMIIHTKQDNHSNYVAGNGVTGYNGYHYGVISLGVGFQANLNNADSNTLNIDGNLTIIRDTEGKLTRAPLISFGSGAPAVVKGTFALNVNEGATLDLQDNAPSKDQGATPGTPDNALICMWGSGSNTKTKNTLYINQPAYVNLQRTNPDTSLNASGDLIRLENMNNNVTVNGNTPIFEWQQGNFGAPSYQWYVNNLVTQNNWGNNANTGFAQKGQVLGENHDGVNTLYNSNATVVMAPNQSGYSSYKFSDGRIVSGKPAGAVAGGPTDYYSPYLNQMLNNFNWWTSQRIAMGSNLLQSSDKSDADLYQPEVKTIDGTTDQTLNDLAPLDGIKDLINENGQAVPVSPLVKEVSWYQANDKEAWDKLMKEQNDQGQEVTMPVPTNPTGKLTTSDTSAWAKVTYADGTVDFVNIPLNITQPKIADKITPSYKPISVEQGKSTTENPSFTDKDGQATQVPAGTSFTTGADTPEWATIDPSTGAITVAPNTDVTPGSYNVPVTVTYSDGSTDKVIIPVTVTKETDADKYDPEGQDVHTTPGKVPDASEGIKNKDEMPSGTTYTWENTPDVSKPGTTTGTVVVKYPDGTTDKVTTTIIVNAKPVIKPINTTVGEVPAASEGIANLNNGGNTPVDGYPSGATWTTAPDTSKSGLTTGTASVTYPDGTTVSVTIPVAVSNGQDINIVDDKGHSYSLHAANVVTHKTSDTNIIGEPVIESFTLSYYEGGQKYSKPYIYTLNADKTAYVLTQVGDNPKGVTVDAVQSVPVSQISAVWTPAGTEFGIPGVTGKGQPSSVASKDNNGTETITYTGQDHTQGSKYVYPMYSVTVDTSKVNWPIFGKGPSASHPFPFVYIYGAEANGTIPSVNSDTTDLRGDLGDAAKVVDTSALTKEHNSEVSSIVWKDLPSLDKADAKAPATVRINFTDGSHLDVPVSVNVIKVDQGVDDKTNFDIYRDITRTINIEGQAKPVIQHVIYSRAKITDLSKPEGHQVTYTKWVAGTDSTGKEVTEFPQVEVTKPGYDAIATGATIETKGGKQYVPASATITPESQNEVVNVTYTANEHTLVITYIDSQTGQQVGQTYNVPGATNETVTVDVPGHVPTNWKLVPGQKPISSYTFDSGNPASVSYKVEHGTEVIPTDKNNKDTYREVTQTIYEIPAGKTEADKVVVRSTIVPFQRTGVKDLVTGNITWNAWQGPTGSFDKDHVSTYELPTFEVSQATGYDSYVNGSKATKVAAVDVNADSQNIIDTITYVKQGSTPVPYNPGKDGINDNMNRYVTRTIIVNNPDGTKTTKNQTVHFTNKDKDGNSGYQDPVTGEVTYNAVWHIAGNLNVTTGTWDAFTPETIKGYVAAPASVSAETVNVTTLNQTVTINYHKDSDKPVKWNGTNDNMYREVTRTIIIHIPNADPQTQLQTVKFTRQDKKGNAGYQDPVTGNITWNAWHVVGDTDTTGTWAAYNAPEVKGYTANPASIAQVTVTPDTKSSTVEINYSPSATTPKDSDKYTPVGQDITVKVGETPNPAEGIKNKGALPEGTKYTWKDTPDTSTLGDKPVIIVVTYPDGTTDEVPVTVHVVKSTTDADKYTPEGNPITITKGDKVPDASEGIKNKDTLPEGTKYTWDVAPDPEKLGKQTVVVNVNYPDGSQDKVTTTVTVTEPTTDADKYTPETQPITTPEGKVPDASEGIKNKDNLPDGTKYTWTDPDKVAEDVKTIGSHVETITVTYPDGSTDTVTVTVNVPAPEGQEITTDQGKLPNPADAIKNKDQMPDGTTYTWQQKPDVSTPGDHIGIVTVHFPDGTTYDVTVTVHVNATTADNNGQITNDGNINSRNSNQAKNDENITKLTANSGLQSIATNKQTVKKTLPQTGNETSKAVSLVGLGLASFASMFGLGGLRKKHNADK